jgi:PAS domain S-box-containing protein
LSMVDINGVSVPVELISEPSQSGTTQGVHFRISLINVSERRSAAEALRQSDQNYQSLINSVQAVVWEADAQTGQFLFVSHQAQRLLGYPAARWQESSDFWEKHIYVDDRERLLQARTRALELRRGYTLEYRMMTFRRRLIWVHDTVAVRQSDCRLMLRGVLVDITRRKLAEDQLHQAHEQLEKRVAERTLDLQHSEQRLRDLSAGILRRQEDERKRISRELHDEIGQALTAIRLNLEIVQQMSQAADKKPRKWIADTQRLVEQTLDATRRFSAELRPALLDDLGLLPAVRSYVKNFVERTGLKVSLKGDDSLEQLSGEIKTTLYRVVQEGLTNISKHARARAVTIALVKKANVCELEVRDDGRGFRAPARTGRARSRGLGLLGIQERAHLLNGELSVQSKPGRGTRIRVVIPLRKR